MCSTKIFWEVIELKMKFKWFSIVRKRIIVLIILASFFILWGFIIFYFSSKPPEVSSVQSNFVYRVLKKIDNAIDFSSMELFRRAEQKIKMWWFKTQDVPADMLIRKTAHFGLYFIFGLLTVSFFYIWKRDIVVSSLLGISLPTLLAVFDEYNQLFYSRNSSLNDVMIDVAGAFFAVFFFVLLNGLYKLIKWGIKRGENIT